MALVKINLVPIIGGDVATPIYGPAVDITDRVEMDSLTDFSTSMLRDQFALGAAKTSAVKFRAHNADGFLSSEKTPGSAFYRRDGSKVIFYFRNDYTENICGNAVLGLTNLEDFTPIFAGYILEEDAEESIENETVTITLLDATQSFERIKFDASKVKPGTMLQDLFLDVVSRNPFATFDPHDPKNEFMLLNAPNIPLQENPDNPGHVIGFDSAENCKDVLDEILKYWLLALAVNNDGTNFYLTGLQAYEWGAKRLLLTNEPEQQTLVKLSEYNSGLRRVYNYFYFEENPAINSDEWSESAISAEWYGFRAHEPLKFSFDKKGNSDVIYEYLSVAFQKRKEITAQIILNYETQNLELGDIVDVKITPTMRGEGSLYGVARYGVGRYADFDNNFELEGAFHIIDMKKDLKNFLVTLKLKQ